MKPTETKTAGEIFNIPYKRGERMKLILVISEIIDLRNNKSEIDIIKFDLKI